MSLRALLPAVNSALGVDVSLAGEAFAVALLIYLVVVGTGRVLKRRFGVRLGRVYQMFCATVAPYVAIAALIPSLPGRTELGAVAALLGTGVLVRLIDQYFWRWYFEEKRGTPVPKFIREVAGAVIFLLAVLLVLRFGYDQNNLRGVLAASGVLGIVLGLALQDSLGNIISGLAIQIGRPFQVGDWLLIDNRDVQAVEINWRSTRFMTMDEVQLDVPNQQIVKQVITNYHGGGSRHAVRLEIGLDCDAPPNRVRDVLVHAAASALGVLSDPLPVVYVKNFGDSSITYEIRYWIDDHRNFGAIADAVRTNVWYAAHRHAIRIPYPIRTLQIDRPHTAARRVISQREERNDAACTLLRAQPLFRGMAEDYLKLLVTRSPVQHYGRGEAIIREGADGASMFVLVNGEAGVAVGINGQSTRVATLHGGDCFGEMSLLTGEKRSASVLAINDCEVLEVTKPVFAEVVARDPALLTQLSELLARRQMETEGIQARAQRSSTIDAKEQEYQQGFMDRLKSFFDV